MKKKEINEPVEGKQEGDEYEIIDRFDPETGEPLKDSQKGSDRNEREDRSKDPPIDATDMGKAEKERFERWARAQDPLDLYGDDD